MVQHGGGIRMTSYPSLSVSGTGSGAARPGAKSVGMPGLSISGTGASTKATTPATRSRQDPPRRPPPLQKSSAAKTIAAAKARKVADAAPKRGKITAPVPLKGKGKVKGKSKAKGTPSSPTPPAADRPAPSEGASLPPVTGASPTPAETPTPAAAEEPPPGPPCEDGTSIVKYSIYKEAFRIEKGVMKWEDIDEQFAISFVFRGAFYKALVRAKDEGGGTIEPDESGARFVGVPVGATFDLLVEEDEEHGVGIEGMEKVRYGSRRWQRGAQCWRSPHAGSGRAWLVITTTLCLHRNLRSDPRLRPSSWTVVGRRSLVTRHTATPPSPRGRRRSS